MRTSPTSIPQLDPQDYTPASFHFDWNAESSLRNWVRDQYNKIRYPLLTRRYHPAIPQTVGLHQPNIVLGGGVGVPRSMLNQKITAFLAPRSICRVLIVGCGTAWNIGQWLRLKPTEVVGVDLYSFKRAWAEVQTVSQQHGIEGRFFQTSLTDLSLIPDGWADVAVSDNVLEHVIDLEAALLQIYRKLRNGGVFCADYGPLWYAPGGDHYSGRGGLHQVYNHLLLSPTMYMTYFRQHLQREEDPQAGARYVPLGLFSKLSSDQYLALYAHLNLKRRFLAVETCPLALRFKQVFANEWQLLLQRYPTVREEEFSIKAHYVIVQKEL